MRERENIQNKIKFNSKEYNQNMDKRFFSSSSSCPSISFYRRSSSKRSKIYSLFLRSLCAWKNELLTVVDWLSLVNTKACEFIIRPKSFGKWAKLGGK
jgi:hypothetical protein